MKKPLWEPSKQQIEQANMTAFIGLVNQKWGQKIADFTDLYQWSVINRAQFWESMWQFGKIISSRDYDTVLTNPDDMLSSKWFSGARLNFAQNLLRFRDDQTAIIFKSEQNDPVRITYAQLYDQVARLARALRAMGLSAGDRAAGFLPNMPQTVIAMLAVTSIGAIWSSCSPDFGIKGVLDRFGQIQPRVLFTADGYFYNGKTFDSLGRIAGFLKDIPSIEKVVVIPFTDEKPQLDAVPNAVYFDDLLTGAPGAEIDFAQLPFDHPLYIMYSSGTTGVPKCIVHGAGGTLIQHLKEHLLHTDLKRTDNIFYFTTCGWMMWNWLVSALAVGATITLFDGSPFYPQPGALFRLAQDEGISVFGTSAKYLSSLEKEGFSAADYDLSSLRAILSTGSPLTAENFNYVYREIKGDLCLSSISGGTDIVSCFALGNPTGPVYAGELQCRGLGMKVKSFDPDGKPQVSQKGELVCTASFPSMPVGFLNDPEQQKYRDAYFSVYPNIWHHGDYIEITATGGVIIYGRSDATLNPGGVRIGTAEIYRQVETLPEILDSLVVGQDWDGDVRVILFVKLAPGVELTDVFKQNIKKAIRENATPRHVPAKIIAVRDIPMTINGKKVELAVRNIIHNRPVLNKDALANPEALDDFQNIPELQS